MTDPASPNLSALATPYALDAVAADERADIELQVANAPTAEAESFREEVRVVRETMAEISASTAVEPPPGLRSRVLAAIGQRPARRWRTAGIVGAAAAAVAIGFGAGLSLRSTQPLPTAEQVFTAADVRTASDSIPSGGTATVVYSHEKNMAVLVMNNVDPPEAGTVYQMWLIENQTPRSAGIMGRQAVRPSTTEIVHDLGGASLLAFTVEPAGGSPQPTGQIFVKLPLS
ncbi:MAG TPA: anti-sigma factor [Mycobacterium sp.]|nr:anti-sigma factor [Mycobacterium sp.]